MEGLCFDVICWMLKMLSPAWATSKAACVRCQDICWSITWIVTHRKDDDTQAEVAYDVQPPYQDAVLNDVLHRVSMSLASMF